MIMIQIMVIIGLVLIMNMLMILLTDAGDTRAPPLPPGRGPRQPRRVPGVVLRPLAVGEEGNLGGEGVGRRGRWGFARIITDLPPPAGLPAVHVPLPAHRLDVEVPPTKIALWNFMVR